jgi:phage terminase Nu1 subunit (DNA packaging protein)
MTKPAPAAKERTFTARQMAEMLGVSLQSISNWKGEGMPCIVKPKKDDAFPWLKCHQWWLLHKYQGFLAGGEVQPKAVSEARLMEAKAELAEMEVETTKRNLIPAAEIEPAWTQAATIVKDRILNIPAAIKLQGLKISAGDLDRIRALLHEALEAIAKCPTQQ